MKYPGGKNAAGTYQRIINQIPPHTLYVEPFLGSGAILRHKRPAAKSLGVDLDPGALARFADAVPALPGLLLVRGDALQVLAIGTLPRTAFVYADPPYLPETRRGGRVYRHELDAEGHGRLLDILRVMPCPVMLSGYDSPLYRARLCRWRRLDFRVMTRAGPAVEVLWMNFSEPSALHDYRYLGADYRQRENLRKQQRRWTARLNRMDRLQRLALLAAIDETARGPPETASLEHRRKRRVPRSPPKTARPAAASPDP